jgi:hypothetical protein
MGEVAAGSTFSVESVSDSGTYLTQNVEFLNIGEKGADGLQHRSSTMNLRDVEHIGHFSDDQHRRLGGSGAGGPWPRDRCLEV